LKRVMIRRPCKGCSLVRLARKPRERWGEVIRERR